MTPRENRLGSQRVKNCGPFKRCVTHINDEHVETAYIFVDIIMPMYNLIEYSDNYADSSGRDESPMNDAENSNNVDLDNSTSFKYKSSLLGKADDADGNDRSIVVPLKTMKI